MLHRREFILASLTVLGAPAALALNRRGAGSPAQELEAIERRVAGRLGVSVLDPATGRRLDYRESERFPMCSTFKWLLAAQILSRVDRGEERLDRRVPFGQSDLLEYAPITRANVGAGVMSVSELCAAAVQYSDNTAANLLLAAVDGPAGFTAWLRGIGDSVTRLDRHEPELNSAVTGDPRDTTTPAAMLADLDRVLLGRDLSYSSRELLLTWLVGNTTGAAKLRAGLPGSWRVGDKTGMGANGATNDVAIMWPTSEAPILVAAHLTECAAPIVERNRALADVGRLVTEWHAG